LGEAEPDSGHRGGGGAAGRGGGPVGGAGRADYRLARSDQEKLVAAPGASPQARRELGDTVNRIGRLLANTGRPREATNEYHTALTIRKKLADDDPADSEFRNALAASLMDLTIPAEPFASPAPAP
jgi:hypothetical protein